MRATLLVAALWFVAAPAPPAPARTIAIAIKDIAFSPVDVKATVGDTIEWTNNDAFVHSATAKSKDWDVVIQPGKKGSLVLKNAGTIEYFCRYHPNMIGKLIVAAK